MCRNLYRNLYTSKFRSLTINYCSRTQICFSSVLFYHLNSIWIYWWNNNVCKDYAYMKLPSSLKHYTIKPLSILVINNEHLVVLSFSIRELLRQFINYCLFVLASSINVIHFHLLFTKTFETFDKVILFILQNKMFFIILAGTR